MGEQIEAGTQRVVCQPWERSSSGDRGPDGFSLYLSHDALARNLLERRKQMPKEAPSSYSWVSVDREPFTAGVSNEVYEQVAQSGDDGFRVKEPCELPGDILG